MTGLLNYKGYSGSVEYSEQDDCLFGKVLYVKSLLAYDGASVEELREQFHQVIDDYLEDCKIDGIEPEKPCVIKPVKVQFGNTKHSQVKQSETKGKWVLDSERSRFQSVGNRGQKKWIKQIQMTASF